MGNSSVTRLFTQGTFGMETVDARRVLGLTLVFVVAEAAILFRYIVFGLLLHATLLFVLFGGIVFWKDHPVYEAFVFVPLLRLLNLGTGIVSPRPFVWMVGVYALLLTSMVLVIRGQSVRLSDLGLRRPTSQYEWAILAGGAGAGIVFGGVQWVFGLEQLPVEPTVTNAFLSALIFGLLVGFVEELLFRGLLQRWVAELTTARVSIVLVSILFGFMHSIWFNPADVLFAFCMSLLIGWLYARTRNFWSIWAWHGLINVMAFAVLPLLVG